MNSNNVYYSRYLCSPEITEIYCQVIFVPRELTWSAVPYRHSNERGGETERDRQTAHKPQMT